MYKYKLALLNEDSRVKMEFGADISAEDLTWKLRDFLCGCSWSDAQVREILNLNE